MDQMVGGIAAGVSGTLIGFPWDTVKTRMQARPLQYPNMFRSFGKIGAEEGLMAFFRGVGAPLFSLTLLNAINFGCYAKTRAYWGIEPGTLARPDARVLLAGAMCGPVCSIISTPFERIKVQMMMDNVGKMQYRSSWHCAQKLACSPQGIRTLWTGHVVNSTRELLFLSTYFGVFEHGKHVFKGVLPDTVAVPISGGMAGMASWLVSYPLDLAKAQVQARAPGETGPGFLTLLRRVVATQGIAPLYNGVLPSVLRAFFVSGTRFSAYEATIRLYRKYYHGDSGKE